MRRAHPRALPASPPTHTSPPGQPCAELAETRGAVVAAARASQAQGQQRDALAVAVGQALRILESAGRYCRWL